MKDTFRVLIATDNHIGYLEQDPIRGEDSFNSFREILQIAKDREVDFILLGGDLFHDNKPSRKSLFQTMQMLREYCLGDRPCPIEFLSDQSDNFPGVFNRVNYQDPNFNVSIPVFSIHGNHDDPSGDGNLCSLDLLSVAGLVNYFGKQSEVDDIGVKPLLMRKGNSKLSLYGLGNIRDERLNRSFKNGKVTVGKLMHRLLSIVLQKIQKIGLTYSSSTKTGQIHPKFRIAHGPTNYIPEHFLESFFHLVLWGHEHECQIDPLQTPDDGFFITQPGSSVATSLCEGESVEKHIGLLNITGKIQSISYKVRELIEEARDQWQSSHPTLKEDLFPKPLIRLKVDYTGGFSTFNPQRFGQNFVEDVANPKDILHFVRKRPQTGINSRNLVKKKVDADRVDIDAFLPEKLEETMVETLVTEFLQAQKLDIFPENELTDIISDFVVKQDKDSIQQFLDKTLENTKKMLGDVAYDDTLDDHIREVKQSRASTYARKNGTRAVAVSSVQLPTTFSVGAKSVRADQGFEDEEYIVDMPTKGKKVPKTTAKRSREVDSEEDTSRSKVSRTSRTAPKPRAPRGKSKNVVESEEEEDVISDLSEEENVATSRSNVLTIDSSEEEDEVIQKPVKTVKKRVAPKPSTTLASKKPAPKKRPTKAATQPSREWAVDAPDVDDGIDVIAIDPLPVEKPTKTGRALPSIFTSSGTKKKALKQSTLQMTAGDPSQATNSGARTRRVKKNPYGG